MNKFIIIAAIFIGLISCEKDERANTIFMRVQNISGDDLTFVTAAGKHFGLVKNGMQTAYQPFEKIIAVPYATINVNGTEAVAGYGYCGSPMPPSLEKGK